ncbi:sodium:proton antiporter [Thalassotalea sp. LPB0316]|uniref:Na+/H+ antiporter NhaC family protein n=1 Tax=Thalassotalea sp. LPB0316 TaxID=2769490 RepID=UPI0018684F9F|nr:Na+/H+ antiporter NhaC family protein [Thalassotalea sp. LPB0316]QOL26882.1 sodium:proton antiporter [Thalassotalea sp. LPB0316]
MQDSPLSLLPPIVAIAVAIWRRNALLALFVGLVLCFVMLNQWQIGAGLSATARSILDVFGSSYNVYIVVFSLLIGALVTLLNSSGAVNGFIDSLARLNLVKNSRQASLLPTVIGSAIFTDTNLSMFTAGTASQKLFDKYRISRARLAFLIDSTCSPISILFLINGWGAYVLGLLDGYQLDDPVGVLIGTIGYNFYAILAVALAYFTAYTGKEFGPLAHASLTNKKTSSFDSEQVAPAYVMWAPLLTLIALTLILLFITGEGDIRRGSGAFSVFWAIITSLVLLIALIAVNKLMTAKNIFTTALAGIKNMVIPVSILVLSFAFGDGIKALGTGVYASEILANDLPLFLLAPTLFIVAGFMAFATGTSWGTFAILIPIAVPIALDTGLPVPYLVAAVLGGGVFGDHASPISDSTVVASIASGCDHIEHVKTQLPYTLFVAIISIVIYGAIGLSLT